jgi:uncharacterized FAD-dependent dehydrogenase
VLNPESNVQFGEGGAGTFSDGKLYSQIKDPKHYGRKVLEEFVKAGAPPEILYVSSVYSFCMCPGGTVVAATSEPNRVVTNGMSQYSRNERNANAGIVVGITPLDYPAGRWPASICSGGSKRVPSNSAAAPTKRRRSSSVTSSPAGHRRSSDRWSLRTSPAFA